MKNKKNQNLMTRHSEKGIYKIDKLHLLDNQILSFVYIIYLHMNILRYIRQLTQKFGHL